MSLLKIKGKSSKLINLCVKIPSIACIATEAVKLDDVLLHLDFL